MINILKKIYLYYIKKWINRIPFGIIIYKKPMLKRKIISGQRCFFPPEFQEKTIGFWSVLNYLKTSNISGDIVECGSGFGISLTIIGNCSNKLKLNKNIYAYDSFSGFPDPTIEDISQYLPTLRSYDTTNTQHIIENYNHLDLNEFSKKHLNLVPGYFSETIPKTEIKKISFLHLDCDLYDSYKICIEHLIPKLSEKGLVLFDEYEEKKWPGATKAINESLGPFDLVLLYSPVMGRHLAVKSRLIKKPSEYFEILKNSLELKHV